MWDRLLTNCNIATMVAGPDDPLGILPNAAIGIQDGRIVRVGRRAELAGFRAREVVPLGGAWVTPGLIDCHTHLIFGANRARDHAMRRAGASDEQIARAGGGIASTVAATEASSAGELLASARTRLAALIAGGCTTVEIKAGHGLDPKSEIRLLELAQALGEDLPVRIVSNPPALHAGRSDALSADHEHLDEDGVAAMAAAGTVAVLLPGAFYALQETRRPPVELLRTYRVPMAVATDCNPGTSPLLSATLAINMACTLFGLTPEEAIAGMTINAAKALGLDQHIGSIGPGKIADLAVWMIADPAELGYWIGLPGPARRIFAGVDA